jgi:hypothetical protein
MDSWIDLLNEEVAMDVAAEASIVAGLVSGELGICQRCGGVFSADAMLGDFCDGCVSSRAAEVH